MLEQIGQVASTNSSFFSNVLILATKKRPRWCYVSDKSFFLSFVGTACLIERPAVKQEKNMALYSASPKLFTTEFNLLKKCLSLVSREV